MIPCRTCGYCYSCKNCVEARRQLEARISGPKGLDYLRGIMPKLDNWPEWDYEAVLRKNDVEVVRAGDYWYTLGWRHGSESINADDEVIARQSAAIFVSLWLRGFSASFADNMAHGYAMWLELQDQRYSFELTKELGNAIIEMSDNGMGPDTDDGGAWNKLVDSAKLIHGREQ